MKSKIEENKMVVELSKYEFWYLAKYFGPGLAFGIEDPIIGLSEIEVVKTTNEAFESLNKAGVIIIEADNQVKMDELLGAMVYSCVHSSDVLIMNSREKPEDRYFHFLPDWQLEVVQSEYGYTLTLFKKRAELFSEVSSTYQLIIPESVRRSSFSINERDLEAAVYLYEENRKEKALHLLQEAIKGDPVAIEEFLAGYIESKITLTMRMIYKRNEDGIHELKYQLIKVNDIVYWLTYGSTPGDESKPIIYFKSLSRDETERRFLSMLPK